MTRALTRRKAVLRGIGGLTLVAAAGLVWRAWDNGVFSVGRGAAYEPWRDWRGESRNAHMALVHAGILAANAHNTQPWRFRLSAQSIALSADHARHLGSFDPFRREMHLSLGCALENMAHAARAQGLGTTVTMTPGRLEAATPADPGPVAILVTRSGEKAETEMFRAIGERHTHRGPYLLDRRISQELIDQMQGLGSDEPSLRLFLFAEGAKKSRLGALIVSATEAIVADRRMAADSARWFRFDWDAVQRHRDGITLDAVGLPSLLNAAAKILPAPSAEEADRQWLAATRDVHVATAPLLGLIAVRDLYDRPAALSAGRLWQRLHLWATARGLAAQPLNQPAEMVDRERELNSPPRTAEALTELTGDPDWKPTFVFRLGYAERPVRLSPRRALASVVDG